MEKPVIYIVDDDESICRSLGRLMRSVGLNVRTFTSAKDFLKLGCWNLPGCLVLDVRMPEMGGLELQSRLAEAGSKMPIIFMSANEDIAARQQGLRGGAVAFLQKPFEGQDLVENINHALGEIEDSDDKGTIQGTNKNGD